MNSNSLLHLDFLSYRQKVAHLVDNTMSWKFFTSSFLLHCLVTFRITNTHYSMSSIINVCCVNVNTRVVLCFMSFIPKVPQGAGNVGAAADHSGPNFTSAIPSTDLLRCVLYPQCMWDWLGMSWLNFQFNQRVTFLVHHQLKCSIFIQMFFHIKWGLVNLVNTHCNVS